MPKTVLYLLETFPQILSETFILSEINELKALGNEIYIVAFYKGIATYKEHFRYDILDKVFYTCYYKNRLLKVITVIGKLLKDIIVKPRWTISILQKIVRANYNFRFKIHTYLTMRNVFSLKIDIIHLPFADLKFMHTARFISQEIGCYYSIVFRAVDIHRIIPPNDLVKKNEIALDASRVITISQYNKEVLKQKIRLRHEILAIHSAIDPQEFAPYEAVETPRIITIARFVEKKGIEYLLDAYRILTLKQVDYNAVIIGEGKLETRYRELIKNYNIKDKVTIKPSMPQDKIIEELKLSMMFVLPCVIAQDGDRDILPNVLKEAMAMETPVITSDISGIGELIEHNKTGIIVPQKDSQSIVDSIINLLTNKELRKKIGRNARKKIIKDFNIENETKKLYDIFDSLMLEDRKSC